MTQGNRGAQSKRQHAVTPRGSAGTVRVRRVGGVGELSGEERYRQGARRTTGEPLAASWEPQDEEYSDGGRKRRPRGLAGLVATYGWRVYALPILVVLTVLVAVDTSGRKGTADAQSPGTTGAAPGSSAPPAVTEKPPKPVDLKIPTADLPGGGAFTQGGRNSWHTVPGTTPKHGNGSRPYTYKIEVEDGLDANAFGGEDAFAHLVDSTLADPRGWTGDGKIAVQRVDGNKEPDLRISLTSPDTTHRDDQCGFRIQYETSCYRPDQGRVVINVARWVRGAKAFGGDMLTYRQYAINHEVGHAFGNGHVGCGAQDALAPVMMQQTLGVNNDYVAQLNQVEPGNRGAVQADGKVCRPNAWPFPG